MQKTQLFQKFNAIKTRENYKMEISSVPREISSCESECLKPKEIVIYSQLIVDIHLVSIEHYNFINSTTTNEEFYENQSDYRKIFMPKTFSVSMFKQMALFFSIYMRRIREHEVHRIQKLDLAFEKIRQVENFQFFVLIAKKSLTFSI